MWCSKAAQPVRHRTFSINCIIRRVCRSRNTTLIQAVRPTMCSGLHLFRLSLAPRIRDLKDRRIYLFPGQKPQPILDPLVGGFADVHHITAHWNDVLRLATSIRSGTVTASAILQKLSAYPRQNGLAVALREIGRIERTLFTLDWLKNIDLRRRANAGLNKGEARNALARAIFFYRLGEMRDRSFESQVYRASGLNLLIAAIILWNTRYLEQTFVELDRQGADVSPTIARTSRRLAGSTSVSQEIMSGATDSSRPMVPFDR